jgi:cytochrome P450
MADKCPVHDHPMPFDDQFFADPHATYAPLYEAGPVHRICLPNGAPAWMVTRYDEARDALRDRRLARSEARAGPDWISEMLPEVMRAGNLVTEDPPAHTRLRQFMNFAFTPQRVEALVPRIHEIVNGLLDAVADAGQADLMSALAAPLPITVIADMLGAPPDARVEFRAWADALLGDDLAAAQRAGQEMLRFAVEVIALKRREPADDLISYWVTATDDDGEPLRERELLGMVFILIVGGFDTTVGTLGNGIAALLTSPDEADALRADPSRFPAAVEEILRYDVSVHTGIRRFATEDLDIGGVRIPAGDTVMVSIGAANRDPDEFDHPQLMDFDRPDRHHLGFGIGVHHCIGAELARRELRVALETLLRRFPKLALAVPPEKLAWRRSFTIRVLQELPVTF